MLIQFPQHRVSAGHAAVDQLLASLDLALDGVTGAGRAVACPALSPEMRHEVAVLLLAAAEALGNANVALLRHYTAGTVQRANT